MDSEITSLVASTSELTDDQKLTIAAKLLGYNSMPVSVDEFVENPYYLGEVCKELYPFWKKKLREIYPSPIHTRYPILVFVGGIGTGKSTFVRVLAMYQLYRILCLKNPHKSFNLMPGKNIKFSFFSYSVSLAQTDFLDVINDWVKLSPFFTEQANLGKFDQFDLVADGTRTNANIGSDVLFYNLSELNFVNKDKAKEKLDQALKRFDSRFGRVKDYFGHVIIDTSSRGDDSIADDFINSNPYGDQVLVIKTNQWVVRSHLNYYFRKGSFKVYAGDSIHQPFIVRESHPITMDMDPDRVIDVPEEVRADFEFDLITALQDKAGISTNSSDRFFPDTTNLEKCFKLPMYSADVIKLDFFDKNDTLSIHLDSYLRRIPTDRIIYIHYDIGVTSDNTGLSVAYFEEWKWYGGLNGQTKVKQPLIKVPISIGLNRPDGQETPIYQLEQFLFDLNERFEIGCFSADQFASRQLFQDLTLAGITNKYISVDRTDEPYVLFKTLSNNGLVELCNNQFMKNEAFDLRRVGKKIDHVQTNSKDIIDSCVGAIYSCYSDLDNASKLSSKYKVETHSQAMLERASTDMDVFNNMLGNIY